MIKGKTIFITGGAGFIGSSIAERLIDNNKIIIFDNFLRDSLKYKNIADHKNIEIIEGDVLDAVHLNKSVMGSNIIIHLASIAGVDNVLKNPTETMRICLIGSCNIFESAKRLKNLERIIDLSTSEVFGNYAYKSEEDHTTSMGIVGEARWAYAVSKLAAEHLLHGYHKEFGLPGVSIRPFNVYGPCQTGESAIHTFIKRALKNETIQIHGDGDQIRSWCYIDDFIDGVLLSIENEKSIGNVYNIGNPKGTVTILHLAKLIIDICKSDSDIEFIPKNYTDVELRIPSIEKARKELGFNPKIDLEEGILKTIEWYKKFV